MGRLFHENISIIFRRGALEVMKREEFLKQLEQLLDGISEEEKADALAFYRSYFEDAGEENEESVIAELESPEKVAQSIKKNLGMEKENGFYGMPADQNPEWNKNDDMFVKSEEVPKEKKGGWSAAAIVVVVLTSPFWLTLLLVVASLLLAVVATLFGIAVAVVAVMASLVFAGFLLIGFGCSTLFTGGVAWTDRSRTFGIGTWNPCSTFGRVGVWRIPSMGSQGNHRFV